MARILLLAPDLAGNSVYPPWQFAGALASVGHRTTLAGRASGAPWPPLAEELGEAVRLPGRWAGLPGARHARELAAAADVVYAFKALPASLGVGLRLRRRTGRPLALHLDDWDAGFFDEVGAARRAWYGLRGLADPEGDLWLRLMERRASRADALTVSSTALRRRFGGELVRQGVDTDRLDPARYPRAEARRAIGAAADEPMVLFLGTPRPHKGLSLSWERSLARHLWLVGGSDESFARAGVPAAVLGRARVPGPVRYDEAARYLAAADVFVVPQASTPYAEHQLPAKLLQAMALGCAIVATDVGDARELLGGDPPAGLTVPAGAPDALNEAVRALLDDPGRRDALGGEARRRSVAELGWRAMARRLEVVLAPLVDRG